MNQKKQPAGNTLFLKLTLLLVLAASTLTGSLRAQQPHSPQDMDRFISALMKRMTVEEKIGQLNLPVTGEITTGQARSSNVAARIEQGLVGGLFNLKGADRIREVQRLAVEKSRLGIPLLFGMDVIHGYETIFPIPLGLSCTWDMDAIRRSARIAAIEASADGISWTFSPMVDISRDPRWGRVSEGSGEDPFLGAAIARAMVQGYQGEKLSEQLRRNDEIMACVKHFALYGAGEAGRDYNTVDMSRNRMFNEFMYPYQAGIEAGAGSVMASFNEIDGLPATGNRWLLTDLLRQQWGFQGFVVTDFTGIAEMTEHGVGDLSTASALALNAGVDMDMVSEGFVGTLLKSIKEGKVRMSTLNTACRRVLEAKYKLGLFDDPYKYCDPERARRDIFTKEHRAEARRIAAESFVLLKNGSLSPPAPLPRREGGGLRGEGTEDNKAPRDSNSASTSDNHPASKSNSLPLPTGEGVGGRGPILPLPKRGTVAIIGPLGNTRANMPGTWSVAARLDEAPSLYEGLQQMLGDRVRFTYAKGSNLVADAAYEERATLFGRSLGRDDRTDQELLDEALKTAADADVIIAALGESSEMSGESSSRTELGIPDVQRHLLEALLATGKPVVLTLFTGRPLTLTWEEEHVPAILNVWFGGSEAAYAIGDVLFGDVNPGGKLTMTFPKNVGQIPLFYNHKNTGRPLAEGKWFEKFRSNYLDVDNEPLYPFGYGLSYTDVSYSDLTLSCPTLTPLTSAGRTAQPEKGIGSVTASVTVTNTGRYDGAEVVQLYIRDLVGSITRPVRELKGFRKIFLRPGESRTVSFEITPDLLRFYDYDLKQVAEPGDFDIMIGTNSRDVKTGRLRLK